MTVTVGGVGFESADVGDMIDRLGYLQMELHD